MKMTTTFAMLRKASACADGYRRLARHLGGVKSYGSNTEINLLTILESNGIDDALWALRATATDCDKEKRLMACDFAELALTAFEEKYPGDYRPRMTIEAARKFANGEISRCELLSARRDAATNAAAAYAAACTAATNAATAAATNAAAAHAADAAYNAAAAYTAHAAAATNAANAAATNAAATYAAAAAYNAAAAYTAHAAAAATDATATAAATAAAAYASSRKVRITEIFKNYLEI